jgi:transglutaminase-like putative cysteine protease
MIVADRRDFPKAAMLIRIGYDIIFNVFSPTPMHLLLYVHPSRVARLRAPEVLTIEPFVPVQKFTDSFGNTCGRIVAPPGQVRFFRDGYIEDDGNPDPVDYTVYQHPVQDLPAEVLPFLLASRYCEVDLMTTIAGELFNNTPPAWQRVQAILDWVHNHITFGYQHARNTKTAQEVYLERAGVCRDFTHLAITLLRAMNIPARYATGYLGDIGVPISPAPMDFSAWLEVYLGHRWWTVDARHNRRRIGRVLMARGRDAADAALTTAFGPTELKQFFVRTDEVPLS